MSTKTPKKKPQGSKKKKKAANTSNPSNPYARTYPNRSKARAERAARAKRRAQRSQETSAESKNERATDKPPSRTSCRSRKPKLINASRRDTKVDTSTTTSSPLTAGLDSSLSPPKTTGTAAGAADKKKTSTILIIETMQKVNEGEPKKSEHVRAKSAYSFDNLIMPTSPMVDTIIPVQLLETSAQREPLTPTPPDSTFSPADAISVVEDEVKTKSPDEEKKHKRAKSCGRSPKQFTFLDSAITLKALASKMSPTSSTLTSEVDDTPKIKSKNQDSVLVLRNGRRIVRGKPPAKSSKRRGSIDGIRFRRATSVFVVNESTERVTYYDSSNAKRECELVFSPRNTYVKTPEGSVLTMKVTLLEREGNKLLVFTKSPTSSAVPTHKQITERKSNDEVIARAGPCPLLKFGIYYLPANKKIPGTFKRSQTLALRGETIGSNEMGKLLGLDTKTKYEVAHIFGDASVIGKFGLLPCGVDATRQAELEEACKDTYIKVAIKCKAKTCYFYVPKSFESQPGEDSSSTIPQDEGAKRRVNKLLSEIISEKDEHPLFAHWRKCIELMADELDIPNGSAFQVNIGPQTKRNYGLAAFGANSQEIFRIAEIKVLHQLGYDVYLGGNASFQEDHYPLARKFCIRGVHPKYPDVSFDLPLDPKQPFIPPLILRSRFYRELIRTGIPGAVVAKAVMTVEKNRDIILNTVAPTPREILRKTISATNKAVQERFSSVKLGQQVEGEEAAPVLRKALTLHS